MDLATKNPGLQHIAEDIFNILDKESLLDCRLVNKSWMEIMNKHIFWLKKLKSETWMESIKDGIFKKLEHSLVDNEQNFKSWEMLVEEIEEDFLNLLIKTFKLKTMSPLEIVFELAEKGKFPNVVNFILEHVEHGIIMTSKLASDRGHKRQTIPFMTIHDPLNEILINHLVYFQNEYEFPKEEDLNKVYHFPLPSQETESESDSLFRHITEITVLTVNLIVEFCKHLPGFDTFDKEDQQTILKACSSEVMMLRAARRYVKCLKYNIA